MRIFSRRNFLGGFAGLLAAAPFFSSKETISRNTPWRTWPKSMVFPAKDGTFIFARRSTWGKQLKWWPINLCQADEGELVILATIKAGKYAVINQGAKRLVKGRAGDLEYIGETDKTFPAFPE